MKKTSEEITIEYIVNVFIFKSNENGDNETEEFNYNFKVENNNVIQARRNAIERSKELLDFFNNESDSFSSPNEASFKNYENYNAFSINIILKIGDDEIEISGNERVDNIENLYFEYRLLKNNGYEFDSINLNKSKNDNIKSIFKFYEDVLIDNYTILEEDYEFLIN